MTKQERLDYKRIEMAIDYIRKHFKDQPSLDEVAEHLHLSPFHFQRMFNAWAGVSPKKFLQFLSIQHAKQLLANKQVTLSDTAFDTGLSGTSRLHDLFIGIEGMTPGEFKNGGENLAINYSYQGSPFGKLLVASTTKGICHLSFVETEIDPFRQLKELFPNACYRQATDLIQQSAISIFTHDWKKLPEIKLHLKGTGFQVKVWEALLKIPMGQLASYSEVARQLNTPKASRAVGSAVGENPVAFLIPCHRVIQSTGAIGQYHWGSTRKAAIIGWEASKTAIGS